MPEFAHPWLLLLAVPVLAAAFLLRAAPARHRPRCAIPHLALLAAGAVRGCASGRTAPCPGWAPRPCCCWWWRWPGRGDVHSSREVEGEGIDIVVALDISGSMLALDFQPDNRLAVAKRHHPRLHRRAHHRPGRAWSSSRRAPSRSAP